MSGERRVIFLAGSCFAQSTAADDVLENIAAEAGQAFLLTAGLGEGDPALDPVYQAGEGQALQVDLTRAGHLWQGTDLRRQRVRS